MACRQDSPGCPASQDGRPAAGHACCGVGSPGSSGAGKGRARCINTGLALLSNFWPSPPLAGTPGASSRKVRPGRAWYLLALAVFLGGAALLVAGLFGGQGLVDGFQRAPLPQGGQVRLDHGGRFVI